MKLGKLINKDNQLQVIIRVVNDNVITHTEPLEDYICKNVMINYNGEFRTIREIIEIECYKYVGKNDVIEF
jgi:hypothetical protein